MVPRINSGRGATSRSIRAAALNTSDIETDTPRLTTPLKTPWLSTRPYIGVPDQTFWDVEEARTALAPGWRLSEPQPYVAWFKSGATMYPMFRTLRERYRQRGYETASLE